MQTQTVQVTVVSAGRTNALQGQQHTFFTGSNSFTVTDYEVFGPSRMTTINTGNAS